MKTWFSLALALVVVLGADPAHGAAQAVNMRTIETPIDPADQVWMEEMTVVEIRDALRAGKTTAMILTGGVEQNGPYLPTGKHNFVLAAVGEPIARRLGNALIAPIVTVEPGNINTPSCFGCTFVSAATYRALLADMATALRGQGFENVVFLGDSGGNQNPMRDVADSLNAKWAAEPLPNANAAQPISPTARVHWIEEYYREDIWSCEYAKATLGIFQQPDNCSATRDLYHDDYHYTSIIATGTKGPERIRMSQRMKAGEFSINQVDLFPIEKTIANGWKLVEYRTDITVRAIEAAVGAR